MSEIKNPGMISATSAVGMCLLFFMLFSLGFIMQCKQMEVKDGLVSPLYSLLLEQSEDDAGENDKMYYDELLEEIHRQSSLESKTFVISETIFPVVEKDKLTSYVKEQLKGAAGVLSSEQVSMVTSMVELLPKASGVLNKGCSGSLRNWAVLALIGLHEGNIHFTMAAAVMEPHMGMLNWIPRSRRNRWNQALSRVVQSRVREEVAKRVLQQQQPMLKA